MHESINTKSMLKMGIIQRSTYRIDSYLSSGELGNPHIIKVHELFEENGSCQSSITYSVYNIRV